MVQLLHASVVAKRFFLKLLNHLSLVSYYLFVLRSLLVDLAVLAELSELLLILGDVELALCDFLDDLRVIFLRLKASVL